MKKLGILFICVFSFLAAFAFGMGCGGCGLAIGDNQARKSAIDDDYLDICELCYEHDNNCDIIQMDYHYIKDGRATWVCVNKDDESQTWLVHLELKKVAPFRYEWVVVE